MTAPLERRISQLLTEYWHRIKGTHILPSERDIEADALSEIWDFCFIIQVRDTGKGIETSHNYSYLGEHLEPIVVSPPGGGEGFLMTLPAEKLVEYYTEMCLTSMPITEEVDVFEKHGMRMKYRQFVAPLGTPEGKIQGFFGGLRYKEY